VCGQGQGQDQGATFRAWPRTVCLSKSSTHTNAKLHRCHTPGSKRHTPEPPPVHKRASFTGFLLSGSFGQSSGTLTVSHSHCLKTIIIDDCGELTFSLSNLPKLDLVLPGAEP
jgi:hypothetical protein